MFSVWQKRKIADAVQKILREWPCLAMVDDSFGKVNNPEHRRG